MTKNTGGPAFPAPAGVAHITEQGMTLRDYFAAKAMQTFLMEEEWVAGYICQEAYRMADVMLKAREL